MEEKQNLFTSPVAISSLSEKKQEYIFKAMDNPSACHLCGCVGIHACVGYPVVWTEDDKKRLKEALGKMFGWENNHG